MTALLVMELPGLGGPWGVGDTMGAALRVAVAVLVAASLAAVVALVYRGTHRGLQYSRPLAFSMVLLACVGTLIMQVIGDSLARAFGVFGALSLIRFRTAVKDPRDIAFVFFALAIGMAAGTGRFVTAATGTLVISAVIGVLHAVRFGTRMAGDRLALVTYSGDEATTGAIAAALGSKARRAALLALQTYPDAGSTEATWQVRVQDDGSALLSALRAIEGVADVRITAAAEEIEL